MSIDERNEALREFREKTSIFISTDAGGEGLNLQFSNIIINYDLPWNPMKIEQRCGRADRIGQKRDVHIYNFIITDTVENRVRDVLEEKLSVILQEMGVDKYSDVLDSEVAECDFTDAYMNTRIGLRLRNRRQRYMCCQSSIGFLLMLKKLIILLWILCSRALENFL